VYESLYFTQLSWGAQMPCLSPFPDDVELSMRNGEPSFHFFIAAYKASWWL
jgi:hypothetical protein